MWVMWKKKFGFTYEPCEFRGADAKQLPATCKEI